MARLNQGPTIAALLLLGALAGPAGAVEHRGAEGWVVRLPEGWVVTPQATVDAFAAELSRRTGQSITYAAGFQREDADPFEYPYVLVQVHAVKRASLSDVCKVMGNAELRQQVAKAEQSLSDITSGSSLGVATIDERRKMVFLTMQSEVVEVGTVHGLIALSPAKEAIVQLNCYTRKDDIARDTPTFERMLDGLQFDAGKGYSPATNPGLIGAGVGLGVALVLGLKKRLSGKS